MDIGDSQMTTHELLVSNLLGWVLILYPTEALLPRWLTLKKAIWQLLPIFVFVAIDYALSLNIAMKKPQCYDVCSGQLSTPAKDEMPYRLTIVYFYKGYLVW